MIIFIIIFSMFFTGTCVLASPVSDSAIVSNSAINVITSSSLDSMEGLEQEEVQVQYSINSDIIKFMIIPFNLGEYTDIYCDYLLDRYEGEDLGIIDNGVILLNEQIVNSFARTCSNASYVYDVDKDNFYSLSSTGGTTADNIAELYPMSEAVINDWNLNKGKYFGYKDYADYGDVVYFSAGTIFIYNNQNWDTVRSLYSYTYDFDTGDIVLSDDMMVYKYFPKFSSGQSLLQDINNISVFASVNTYFFNYTPLVFIGNDRCKEFINNIVSGTMNYYKMFDICFSKPVVINLKILENTNLDKFLQDLRNYIQGEIDKIVHDDKFLINYYKLLSDCSLCVCNALMTEQELTIDSVFNSISQDVNIDVTLYDLCNLVAYGIAWIIWFVVIIFIVIICLIIYRTFFSNLF